MSQKIYLLETDRQKLIKLIDDTIMDNIKNKEMMKDLKKEIDRAEVVGLEALPQNVITMHSRVLLSLDGIDEEIMLVYPCEADADENRISVLSPVGTAIIGYREGDWVEWKVPSGVVKVEIKKVLYQPETVDEAAIQQRKGY